MNIKNIVYTALVAGFAMCNAQINAQLPRDPKEALRELGHTPGMKAKEEKEKAKEATDKELSIVNEKVIILAEKLNQAKKQQDNDQIALKEHGGSHEARIQAQRRYGKAFFDYEYFKSQNSQCNNVDCFNSLLEKLQKWNQEN